MNKKKTTCFDLNKNNVPNSNSNSAGSWSLICKWFESRSFMNRLRISPCAWFFFSSIQMPSKLIIILWKNLLFHLGFDDVVHDIHSLSFSGPWISMSRLIHVIIRSLSLIHLTFVVFFIFQLYVTVENKTTTKWWPFFSSVSCVHFYWTA